MSRITDRAPRAPNSSLLQFGRSNPLHLVVSAEDIEGIPANGFTYSVDSEVYQDAAIDRVPEDLVAGLMETAERDFRRGFARELVAAEKATDGDIAAETINSNHEITPWRSLRDPEVALRIPPDAQ